MKIWEYNPISLVWNAGKAARKAIAGAVDDTSDRDRYNQQLQGDLSALYAQLPDLMKLYNQGRSETLDSWKGFQGLGTDSTNKYYDQAKSNLNFNMNTQVGDAQSSAGALAASRGFANPSGFVNYSGQGVRNSFVPQFGELEGRRFGALGDIERYNNQGQNASNMNYTQLLQMLAQGRQGAAQGDFANRMGLFNTKAGMADNYDPYSNWDKTLQFAGQVLPAAFGGG